MGAWGLGPLENDDACDWLADLGENGAKSIDEAFEDLLDEAESECIDSGLGANAVAALEILSRIKEGSLSGDELLEASGVDLAGLKSAFTSNRQAQALKAAEVVLAENSELQQLWADADQLDEWTHGVQEIVKRLID